MTFKNNTGKKKLLYTIYISSMVKVDNQEREPYNIEVNLNF